MWWLNLLKSKLLPWSIVILLIVSIILLFVFMNRKEKEFISPDVITNVDSTTTNVLVSHVTLDTYHYMADSLSNKIKEMQKDLEIRDRDLIQASRVIANLKSKGYGKVRVDTVEVPKYIGDTVYLERVDSIHLCYEDSFTHIEVEGTLQQPDSVLFDFQTNSNFTIIQHTDYKKGKNKCADRWYKFWRVGKHETFTLESDNPALDIEQIKVIRINE